MRLPYVMAGALAIGALAACSDPLQLDNENDPDRNRILGRSTDAEQLAGGLYQQILYATTDADNNTAIPGIVRGLLTAAFENSSGLANNGMGPRSGLPRGPIDNGRSNPYVVENARDFGIQQQVARQAADVLHRVKNDESFVLPGGETQKNRLKGWTHFVYGLALGNVALAYDSAAVPKPGDEATFVPPLEGYAAVMEDALKQLDSAVVYASLPGTPALPANWMNGNAFTPAEFIRVVRSHAARLRAGVARNLEERDAVDWAQVIDDATNGITSDLMIEMDPANGWDVQWLQTTLHFRDANWHQMPYHIIGMADSSGNFDTWLAQDRDARTPFLIRTLDQRFPSGDTRAEQNAVGQGAPTGRRYFRNRNPSGDQAGVGWQNSQYDHYRFRAFGDASRIGPFPVMTRAEIDLLAAEGYIRTGNISAAAALIDRTRTTAGLPALSGVVTTATQPVPGGNACVPRVPQPPTYTTTACGNIMEAMKWEKRMETAYTGYGQWFFDSRGWGDLAEGTAVHWPVPFQERDARLLPIYNLGGVGQLGGAGPSTYGYGSGNR